MSRRNRDKRPDRATGPLPTLVFHKVVNQFSFGVTNYSPIRFERLLRRLSGFGWTSVVSRIEPAGQGRGMLVSFDDGYQHLAEVLPDLMTRLNLRPLVFVPTGLIGRSNSWDYSHRWQPTPHLDRAAIRRLAGLSVTFGSHGVSHCDLTACASEQLHRELSDSRKFLQDLTGQEISLISYPFGRCNQRVIDAAGQSGYQYGFTMTFPRRSDPKLAVGRYPVYSFDTCWSVRQKIEKGPGYRIERFKTQTISRLSGGTVILNRLRSRRPG